MSKSGGPLTGPRPCLCTDLALGNSVGAIGWPTRGMRAHAQSPTPGRGRLSGGATPFRLTTLAASVRRARPAGPLHRGAEGSPTQDSYLVDSASSHMLVSKIKPCMSKYKQLYGETANGSLNQLSFI